VAQVRRGGRKRRARTADDTTTAAKTAVSWIQSAVPSYMVTRTFSSAAARSAVIAAFCRRWPVKKQQ